MNKTADKELTTKEKVLALLKNHPNQFISGQEIADKLFITRAGIWKAIKSLRESGYKIESITNRGYRLCLDNDFASESFLNEQLSGHNLVCKVYDEVSSTNDFAKDLSLSGSFSGSDILVVSASQTKGRGRKGRSFFSPKGSGLYFSLLLHPDISFSKASFLTALAAESLALSIEECTDKKVSIKWVNDIFLNNKKIAGILTESFGSLEEECPEYVVIGIGLNVYPFETDLPKDLKKIVGYLTKREEAPENLINDICVKCVEHIYSFIDEIDKKTFLEGYKAHSNLIGKYVRISDSAHSPGKKEYGLVTGIDDECRLLVKLDNETNIALSGREVSVMKY